ncbi:cell division-specific peptidoglycan biosynthesis regulator FtsW [Paraoerskovia marina]|uniref:Probable peptidoglycan glycosyltransferase FtsW n=1 Tax=Paraoerskovia marina TaxID=545619 RepID=A0A1H1TQI4_9CELL|nr:putative peptidoglycan glycosyltransferase FtsW [Paraoerskovia marina]SDS62452.1 cell division-specific peptidoglycan biosynthesis regulator FtsW [Paraoerskovia marina]
MAPAATARSAPRPVSQGRWDTVTTSYYLIIGSTGLLLLLGLIMVLSASAPTQVAASASPYGLFFRQSAYAAIGLVGLVVASRLPVAFYRRSAPVLLLAALFLQALTLTGFGHSVNGNSGWLDLGGVTVQPAEILKLALALWLGAVLGRKRALLGQWRHVLVPAAPVVVIALGLVLGGNDLGTTIVLCLVVAAAFIVSGAEWKLLTMGGVLAAVGMVGLFVVGNSNRTDRISAVYGACADAVRGQVSSADAADACYQSVHGMWGLATGGLLGVGLGSSREKWSYLPAAVNDFIYSVLGEEFGLFGTLVVLALFGVLGFAMARVVMRHPDPFVKVATAGISAWIVGQAIINICVVVGLLPVIGVPLPLMSAGGSALIATLLAIGVVLAFARDEPGAREALAARPHVIRRTFSVVAGATRRVPLRRGGSAK